MGGAQQQQGSSQVYTLKLDVRYHVCYCSDCVVMFVVVVIAVHCIVLCCIVLCVLT